MSADTRTHHVEAFHDDETRDYGWQCFTCGAQRYGFLSFENAMDAADEHEGACACASH